MTEHTKIAMACMEAGHWQMKDQEPYICEACYDIAVAGSLAGWELAVAAGNEWKRKFEEANTLLHRKTAVELADSYVEGLRGERDEWKRKALACRTEDNEEINILALQNRELRKALKLWEKYENGDWDSTGPVPSQVGAEALALTPTQAEKIVAVMEDIVKATDRLDIVRPYHDALDAARKEQANE